MKILTETSPGILRYYDPKLPIWLQGDASKSGLGTVLIQDSAPIAYASRSPTETENRYAQIEKELLAVVFGCERFHQYIYAKESKWVWKQTTGHWSQLSPNRSTRHQPGYSECYWSCSVIISTCTTNPGRSCTQLTPSQGHIYPTQTRRMKSMYCAFTRR